ncbi:MAG: hypothetical protein JEZ01_15465 [Labilibaculum sp.]|nr:hypothetical protein [Labilibaculum sp.]MBI9059159.1 hypothetical protein [Labilibaculum sp.]
MNKFNYLFALLLGALVSFTSCDKDDDLSPEELEAKQTEELIETITANFDAVTTKKWSFKEFQPSADMLAASTTQDGVVALTTIVKAEQAPSFNMVVSFITEGDFKMTDVAVNVPEADLEAKLIAYQDAIAGFPAGFLYDTKEYYLSSVRRIVAAPFAADEDAIEDIVNEDTGECILKIKKSDFSTLTYEDVVLAQKKMFAGNGDKIYINEDGSLTVEVTSEDYGVSKYIYNEVTE